MLGLMSVSVRKLTLDKRSFLRVLVGVYLILLFLICFDLSVPPADLPFSGLLFVLAVIGIVLARRERRAWRLFWTGALILALAFPVLEVIAGWRIAKQRSEDALLPKIAATAVADSDKTTLRNLWASPDYTNASVPTTWLGPPPCAA